MIYSAFDAQTGLYNYFADDATHPLNGDLPVPKIPKSAGVIGAAAIECGRPLPAGARFIGSGWEARGMICQLPKGSGLGADPPEGAPSPIPPLTMAVGAAAALLVLYLVIVKA